MEDCSLSAAWFPARLWHSGVGWFQTHCALEDMQSPCRRELFLDIHGRGSGKKVHCGVQTIQQHRKRATMKWTVAHAQCCRCRRDIRWTSQCLLRSPAEHRASCQDEWFWLGGHTSEWWENDRHGCNNVVRRTDIWFQEASDVRICTAGLPSSWHRRRNIFQRFANLGHGQLEQPLGIWRWETNCLDRSRFGSPPCHGLLKGSQFLSYKRKEPPCKTSEKFCRVNRRQNESGVLRGGKNLHGE